MKKYSILCSAALLFCCLSFPRAQEAYEEAYAAEDAPQDDMAADYEDYADYADYEDAAEGETLPAPPPPALPAPETNAPVPANTNTAVERYIPLFSQVRPAYTVDPNNPRLPDNHPLLRLKGTLWRSDQSVLSTNGQGVVSAQRLYLVFARRVDAIAFALAPYEAPSLSAYPRLEDYIPLTPLLETNAYKPSPYAGRYVEIPEKFRRPTTNALTGIIPEQSSSNAFDPTLLQSQQAETGLDPQAPSAEPPAVEEAAPAEDPGIDPEGVYEEPLDEAFPQDYPEDYPENYPLEEEAPEDGYALLPLKTLPQKVLLQQPVAGTDYAVINFGGLDGGIFVYENRTTPETPYTVLFLALEKDGSLSAYMIKNSFDIRSENAEIAKARELYKKAFQNRSNMKKFYSVPSSDTLSSPLLNFFK